MREYITPIPLDEALAAVDSPEAVADRKKRAKKWAEQLEGRARGEMIFQSGTVEVSRALEPIYRSGTSTSFAFGADPAARFPVQQSASADRSAEIEAGRNMDELVARQCEIYLRAEDVRAIYIDPDRYEDERIRQAYNSQVAAVAWSQGSKEASFVATFKELIAERRDAEAYGDNDGVRSAERRLERLTGVPWPQLPGAAWDAADTLPETERQAEYDRLTEKYGPRDAATNGAGTTSRRPRLSTRPMPALNTR